MRANERGDEVGVGELGGGSGRCSTRASFHARHGCCTGTGRCCAAHAVLFCWMPSDLSSASSIPTSSLTKMGKRKLSRAPSCAADVGGIQKKLVNIIENMMADFADKKTSFQDRASTCI